ncbi:nucleotidyltransferase [Cyclobacterium sp.]|uniref:nucleotidyltransferase n=1 Tax=Cyclobacterium sp. TaxID=1966343 RepID=UPI0019C1646B|nr:nucleotidyltransferase [Cyclobacterium sp.]MBD3628424.1 nucleotidyltransferase [Cyclobacterium sp.]
MTKIWKENIDAFLKEASKEGVKMLLVGGGAVNFHGYQRHSADVDFWIDTSEENFSKLLQVFQRMGYEIDSFPDKVKRKEQNISVKFSPADLNLELITNFQIGKSFDEAFAESVKVEIREHGPFKWNVLNLYDLLESKRRAARPKDLLDILELKSIHKLK